MFRTAIINKAAEIDAERRRKEIEATAALVGNRVGEIMTKALKAALGG